MATQLIPLPEVERLSASVVRILGGNPGKVGVGKGRQSYECSQSVSRLIGLTNGGLWHIVHITRLAN